MSKIAISVAKPTDSLKAAKLIHDVVHLSIKSARDRLLKGKKGVFYTTELFLNDHQEKDKEIRKIVNGLEALDIEVFVLEISHDELWKDVTDFDSYRISSLELISILDNCEDYE